MNDINTALRVSALLAILLALAGCSGDRMFGNVGSSPAPAPANAPSQPGAPPVSLGGRWLLSTPGRGQCHMTFGAASPTSTEGTIAPEGGCPGKFFTSRKWTYDQNGLTMRDHNGQPLAQLSGAGGQFNGKSTAGDPVTLMR